MDLLYTRVYTDGACTLQPHGHGGWAWAVDLTECPWYARDEVEGYGGQVGTTNQRMEVTAAFEALKTVGPEIEIVSDSKYVVDCFNKRWYTGWHKNNWKNSSRKPVANRDLWEPFVDLYLPIADQVRFTWVKGHNGHAMNEYVDALAVAAKLSLRKKDGS